ncbi:hypothetical protein [Deinococcus sonorensis]|uniref:NERD domain-containing protein n=2 Tax=Deinococcus sonorensis TaxID=309891 RepID=A0AAU7UG77_9DEIO
MRPTLYPPTLPPDTEQRLAGEAHIFRRLATCDRPWTVLHSLGLPNHPLFERGEADFVVLAPTLGVAVLEIKGHGQAWIDPDTRLWHLGYDPPRARGPVQQAHEAMYSVRERLRRHDQRWGSFPYATLVLLPFAELDGEGEWKPWELADRLRLKACALQDLIEGALRGAREGAGGRPDVNDVRAMADVLRPALGRAPDLAHRRAAELARGEAELKVILDAAWDNPRLQVHGQPGAGRGWLVRHAASRAAEEGRRALIVTPPGALLPQAPEGVTVQSLDQALEDDGAFDWLGMDLGESAAPPEALDTLFSRLTGGPSGGRWLCAAPGDLPGAPATLTLRTNRRTLPRPAAFAHTLGRLTPPWPAVQRPDDLAEVSSRWPAPGDDIGALAELLNDLRALGFAPGEIAVLSGAPAPQSLAARAAAAGLPLAPWAPQSTTVGFASILDYARLEAPAVVLTDLPHGPEPQAHLRLGATRSVGHLAVIAGPTFLTTYLTPVETR